MQRRDSRLCVGRTPSWVSFEIDQLSFVRYILPYPTIVYAWVL